MALELSSPAFGPGAAIPVRCTCEGRDVSPPLEWRGIPAGTIEGVNDWKRTGYGGPCPPVGRHRYFHKLYALDTVLTGLDRPTKAQVEAAMKGHVLGHAELVGTYAKMSR